MHYNHLGRSGLKVSELSFGSWLTFGTSLDEKRALECMRLAYDAGVNFFDNAEVYGRGESERVMGKVLKEFKRESVVVSTKIFWGGDGPNDTGLSWKHLVEGTRASLRRLDLEYVDLLFCHRPDPHTPVEETVRAMDFLIRQGYAFYWGTSEWPAERIVEAFEVSEKTGSIPPTMEQPQYNMLTRDRFEKEYATLFRSYKLGATVWSPLASGMLTGKYKSGIPSGSRLEKHEWLREKLTPDVKEKLSSLEVVAHEVGCSLSQLAIAWCLKNPNVSTVILGATSAAQLEENLDAVEAKEKLSEDVMAKITSILDKS